MAKNVRRIRMREEDQIQYPVSEVVQEYLATAHVKQLDQKTQIEYRQELGVFASWCASHAVLQKHDESKAWYATKADTKHHCITLDKINDQVIHLFIEHLKATHRPAKKTHTELSTYTLQGYVRVIKSFLNWCLLDETYGQHMKYAVIQRIKKPRVEEQIFETFTEEQVEALFKACDREESTHLQVRDRAIIALLLDSGIRAHELVTLKIGHIHLDAKDAYVRVQGKRGKWGEVGLGEQARRALQKYIRMFRTPTLEAEIEGKIKALPPRQAHQVEQQIISQSVVFMNRYGKQLTVSGLGQIIERLGRWANIPESIRCSPHTFRHTFSVMFMRNGGDIYTLSKLLRHTSVKTTENYLKALRQSEARRGAKSVLDNL